jgi:cation diffusion facilitator CzcD-associated flavoprotein CzcO
MQGGRGTRVDVNSAMMGYMDDPPEYEVAIIGSGFGGLGMAVRLKRSGVTSPVILEKADEVGGTWRDNTYPGAACDIPSHLYSFSFRAGEWSRRFPSQPEILRYLRDVVRDSDLRPHLRFGAEVTAITFDEAAGAWEIRLATGEVVTARAVVSSVGQLNRPALPDIPGQDSFQGASWHSARWDHTYDLDGRRVAVVGTGASAVQFVPVIARRAAAVHVFQRSAPYVIPKPDGPEHPLYRRLPVLASADRLRTFLTGELLGTALFGSVRLRRVLESRWRAFMESQVHDAELRERCVPDYVIGCKRILFSNDWYPTLALPTVELVTERVTEITPRSVVTADGCERAVDAIVYGTGFQSTGFLQPMRVVGKGGLELHEVWRGAAEAYRGVVVSGFPNFFMLYGPNTNLGSNSIIYMLESQIAYVDRALRAMRSRRLRWLDVRKSVQDEFNRWVQTLSARTVWMSGCHNWYTVAGGRNTNNWPTYTFRYRRALRRFDLRDYETA